MSNDTKLVSESTPLLPGEDRHQRNIETIKRCFEKALSHGHPIESFVFGFTDSDGQVETFGGGNMIDTAQLVDSLNLTVAVELSIAAVAMDDRELAMECASRVGDVSNYDRVPGDVIVRTVNSGHERGSPMSAIPLTPEQQAEIAAANQASTGGSGAKTTSGDSPTRTVH
jgi:hypothetical protein